MPGRGVRRGRGGISCALRPRKGLRSLHLAAASLPARGAEQAAACFPVLPFPAGLAASLTRPFPGRCEVFGEAALGRIGVAALIHRLHGEPGTGIVRGTLPGNQLKVLSWQC